MKPGDGPPRKLANCAGQLLEVLDEVAQPKVKQATADEIFLGPNRS